MRFYLLILIVTVSTTVAAVGQSAEPLVKYTPLILPAGATSGKINGNLNTGVKIPLGWAESSSVACFPATRFEMFGGNHVFYRITLPAASHMTLTLVPKNRRAINLYALRQGSTLSEWSMPPNVERAISCEASYPIYATTTRGSTIRSRDSGTRKIEFVSIDSPFSILVGVAGAKGLAAGDFTLHVSIKRR